MIPGNFLSAFPHRQFHTLPGLLDSWAALPNSYPNACMPMQGGSLYHFYDGLLYDPAERRTHDLPWERRTRYRLSQPDTVSILKNLIIILFFLSYSFIMIDDDLCCKLPIYFMYFLYCMNWELLFRPDPLQNKVDDSWMLGVRALISQRGGLVKEGGFFDNVQQFIKDQISECSTLNKYICAVCLFVSL